MSVNINSVPRHAKLVKCAILSPGLGRAAQNEQDRTTLETYGFDLIPFVQRIDIFESIFDNTLSGTINIIENIGLTEYLPIVGVETVVVAFEVRYGTDVRQFKRAFRVVGLKDQSFPRHDYRMYTLQLATHEFVKSVSSRIKKAYQNVKCEQAIKSIVTTYLGADSNRFISYETTSEPVSVVIPNYTPLMAINYFTMLARTAQKESNFLFFETLDGFHFSSISSMIQAGRQADSLLRFDVNNSHIIPTERVENNIIRVHQNQSFDLLMDIASGTLRSRLIHFDFLARDVKHIDDSRYSDTFKKTTHLENYPFYPNNFDLTVGRDVRTFMFSTDGFSTQSKYYHSTKDGNHQHLKESVVLRNRQLREIRHLETLIELPGNPQLRAGTVVEVNYPSTRPLQSAGNQPINTPLFVKDGTPYYSGKHLVTSVHHILTAKTASFEYDMHVKVNRDSLSQPLFGTSNKKGE